MKRIFALLILLSFPACGQTISQLPQASTPLTGAELIPLTQNGVTKKATQAQVVGTVSNPNITGATITNSTINSTVIGALSRAAGYFSTLYADTITFLTVTLNDIKIAQSPIVDVRAYGASPSGRKVFDIVTTSGSANFSSATGGLTSALIGKPIVIYNNAAGDSSQAFVGTIATITSGTTGTFSGTASASCSSGNCTATYGSDQTSAVNQAITAACAMVGTWVSGGLHAPTNGGYVRLEFPTDSTGGIYTFTSKINIPCSGVILDGTAWLSYLGPFVAGNRTAFVTGNATTGYDILNVDVNGASSCVQLGETGKQSHAPVNYLSCWNTGRDTVDTLLTPPYMTALELRGNNWTGHKLYTNNGTLGFYARGASDITGLEAHLTGNQYGAYVRGSENLTLRVICDSVGDNVITDQFCLAGENGVHNSDIYVRSFSNSAFDRLLYVVRMGLDTAGVNSGNTITVDGERSGSNGLYLDHMDDTKIEGVLTNSINACGSGCGEPYTTGVVYGSSNTGSVATHLTLDDSITNPSSGTVAGTFTYDTNTTTTFSQNVAIASTLTLKNGSASSPSLVFSSDTQTGLYRVGSGILGLTTGGALRLRTSSAGTVLDNSGSGASFTFAAGTNQPSLPSQVFGPGTNSSSFGLARISNDTLGPWLEGAKSNGSVSGGVVTRAAVASGTSLLTIAGEGDDGTATQIGGTEVFKVDGAVSTGIVPGRIEFSTTNSSGTTVLGMTITATQLIKAEAGIVSTGTKFTTSGCSVSATTGGSTAGTYTSGTTGTCTAIVTMAGATGQTAPNGWSCWANDFTTPADLINQTATTATTATLVGTTVSGDVINFGCIGY